MTTPVRASSATLRVARWLPGEATSTGSRERLLVLVIGLAWSTTLVVDFRIALAVLMVIGFGGAVAGLRYRRFGLLGIGMLCTLNEIAAPLLLNAGGPWRWNTVNYWLLLYTLLFFPKLLGKGQPQARIILAFSLLLGLELLLSPDPERGVQHLLGVVTVFGLLIYFRRVGPDVDAWYWLGVVSGVLAAGCSAAFLLQRDRLPYVDPNSWSHVPLAAMVALCLAFEVTWAYGRRRLELAVLTVINAVWVLLSASRGSILVAAVCLAFLFTLMNPRRAVWSGIIAAVMSIVVLSEFTPLKERAVARLQLLADPNKSLAARTSGRSQLALGAWYIFHDHPFGVGTGGFTSAWLDLGAHEGMAQVVRGRPMQAHSEWMKILAENGLPGIMLLGAYVISFTVSGWRTRIPELRKLGLTVTMILTIAWVSTEVSDKALWLLAAGATVLLDRRGHRGRLSPRRPRSTVGEPPGVVAGSVADRPSLGRTAS